MQQMGVAVDGLKQSDPPQRRGAPLNADRFTSNGLIAQSLAEVMEQQVAVGAYLLKAETLDLSDLGAK